MMTGSGWRDAWRVALRRALQIGQSANGTLKVSPGDGSVLVGELTLPDLELWLGLTVHGHEKVPSGGQ
ncbi:hypothetical protein ORI20_26575 [Mycobacterium sp. CVI_P3]|uniref:Uncharacterized protein n=1 Tax=Mycobacterium pinniadriaticum TaxID=2994102 RepID=A0ABT3SLA5_9MYCO|nr:hypothetical protein [Mycobacterium pinniadriaticum]MCX2933842.1 hypothetical protein [Mycobacterium pinniadriaticum]MCX2940305.1 hypothetical protein [Mycobacterium pinniadriaticum]